MEKRDRHLLAHNPRYRQSYAERSYNALKHDKLCASAAVEVADKAEQERGQQAVYRIGFQIFRRRCDNFRAVRKDACQYISMEECEVCYHNADDERGGYAAQKSLSCPFRLLSADVLSNKRRHRLHISRRDEHYKSA